MKVMPGMGWWARNPQRSSSQHFPKSVLAPSTWTTCFHIKSDFHDNLLPLTPLHPAASSACCFLSWVSHSPAGLPPAWPPVPTCIPSFSCVTERLTHGFWSCAAAAAGHWPGHTTHSLLTTHKLKLPPLHAEFLLLCFVKSLHRQFPTICSKWAGMVSTEAPRDHGTPKG